MATEFVIGLQPPESVTLTPNSNLKELILITERVNKITIVGKHVENDEILSALLFNGDDIDLRVRDDDPAEEDTPLLTDNHMKRLFQDNQYRGNNERSSKVKSLDLVNPFFDRIIMQQTCYSAPDQPNLYWRRITYLKISLGNKSIEIGKLRPPSESIPGKYRILPKEVVDGPCMISGIGMHNTDLICLQVIALQFQNDVSKLQLEIEEHMYAYGKSSVGLVNLTEDQLKSVEKTAFAAIESSDPDVMSIINKMSDFMFNWYSSRSSIHRVFPDLYQVIDKAITENDRSIIFAVFRLSRHLRWRICNEVQKGHNFDRDPFVRLKIFKVVECLSDTLEICQRFIVNKPSIDCYSVAYLSGDIRDVIIAGIVLVTQIGLTFMLFMSVVEANWGQITFLPWNERLVITPVLTIFSAMLVHKQVSNALSTFKAYPNMKTSLMGLFEVAANIVIGIIVLFLQVVIIAKSEDNVEYVLNSIAAIFILELDDNVVFLDDDGITDLNRRLLMKDFNRRVKLIENSFFKFKDWRTARNSYQIINYTCELKTLPPIQFASSSRSLTSSQRDEESGLEPAQISFIDEQSFSYAFDGWAEIASSPAIISSNLRQESKATLTFSWRDQGWGNRKGKLRVRLINSETGEDVASTPEYGIAPHEYESINEQFDFKHGLVRNSTKGCKFVVEIVVGGGGGHELRVKDFHFNCTAGLTSQTSSTDLC